MYNVVSADSVDLTPRVYSTSKEEIERAKLVVDTKVPITASHIINEALRQVNGMIDCWNAPRLDLLYGLGSLYAPELGVKVGDSIKVRKPKHAPWDPENRSTSEYRAWRERGGGT
jgi:hypothetical protein